MSLDLLNAAGRELAQAAGLPSPETYALVAARLAGLAAIGPFFGQAVVPYRVRTLLVAGLAMVAAPFVAPAPFGGTLVELCANGLAEFALGLSLAFGAAVIVAGARMAGGLIDQQLGLSLGGMFDSEFGPQGGAAGPILPRLAWTAFLAAGGHLVFVTALLDSFQAVPPGSAFAAAPPLEWISGLVQQSFELALRVAAPVLAVTGVAGLASGYLAQAVPQVSGLVSGLPIRALAGLVALTLTLTAVADLTREALIQFVRDWTYGF